MTTYSFANREEGWMRVCGAKTLAYVSKEYGDVVLIRWANGMCSILREAPAIDSGRGGVSGVHISAECMQKLDELRGQPPEGVSPAVGPGDTYTATWAHDKGGTIQTKTTMETPITHTGNPKSRRRKKK